MRDKLKNEEYYRTELQKWSELVQGDLLELRNDMIIPEKVNSVKQILIKYILKKIMCRYSVGDPIDSLRDDLLSAIDMAHEGWDGFWKVSASKRGQTIVFNEYICYGYDQILWMLSLGYLLEIQEVYIRKLVEVIDRDEVKDFLLEFIIRAMLPERPTIKDESYQRSFLIPDSFKSIREAIAETDTTKAELSVERFVTKEWYKYHKKIDFCHGKRAILAGEYGYWGYWSWETAAVVKIMGLDDSRFKKCPYYPKDMIR